MNANITLAQEWIAQADAILIGASNGLSIAEGYHIFANNENFHLSFLYSNVQYRHQYYYQAEEGKTLQL